MKVFWKGAPRWLSVPIYIALGWAPVFFFGDFVTGAIDRYGAGTGTAVMVLVAAGGALYTIGGVVYGTKRPNPWPQLVRLPRGVPHLHDPGVRHPLRRRLAGDVLAALRVRHDAAP